MSLAPDLAAGTIPKGALRLRFTFSMSMSRARSKLELKPLDANGDSTDGTTAGLALTATWSDDAASAALGWAMGRVLRR